MTLDIRLIRFSHRDTAMRTLGWLEASLTNARHPAERERIEARIQDVLRGMPGPGK